MCALLRPVAALALALLAACSEVPTTPTMGVTEPDTVDWPNMRIPESRRAAAPTRSNADMARDFLDLAFEMESGTQLRWLSRFENPISLRLIGQAPETAESDLDNLLRRLRSEAGISITRVPADHMASITVQMISKAELQRAMPTAACFVAPRVTSWNEFRRTRRAQLDWTTLERRETVSIFIPYDVSPQEIRDCMHEEIAQALGPLNDLFRLPDSVFNDDNFHTVLTGFDMLMLRVYYAPDLRSGMTRRQAALIVPALLRRYNPGGESRPRFATEKTDRAWIDITLRALAGRSSDTVRRQSAQRMMQIAQSRGWQDNRLAFAQFVYGRAVLNHDTRAAYDAFLAAHDIYAARRPTRIHAAHTTVHLALFDLSGGAPENALRRLPGAIDAARTAENASLLATLLIIQAEAQDAVGQDGARTRREALSWGQYGFPSRDQLVSVMQEIASIAENSKEQT